MESSEEKLIHAAKTVLYSDGNHAGADISKQITQRSPKRAVSLRKMYKDRNTACREATAVKQTFLTSTKLFGESCVERNIRRTVITGSSTGRNQKFRTVAAARDYDRVLVFFILERNNKTESPSCRRGNRFFEIIRLSNEYFLIVASEIVLLSYRVAWP